MSEPRRIMPLPLGSNSRIGIARDRAFGFYYADDLDALQAAGAELVIDTVRRIRASVTSEPIAGRIGIELVGAQFAVIGPVLIVQLRRVHRVRVVRTVRTIGTAELTEAVVHRIRCVRTPMGTELVRGRVRRIRICTQLTEVLGSSD